MVFLYLYIVVFVRVAVLRLYHGSGIVLDSTKCLVVGFLCALRSALILRFEARLWRLLYCVFSDEQRGFW